MVADGADEQPAALVTEKVYEPWPSPVIVVVVPFPVVVIPPGFLVKVHVPVTGNPFNTTLPVAKAHVGCVIAPVRGAPGIPAGAVITILEEGFEVQPLEFVTVHV